VRLYTYLLLSKRGYIPNTGELLAAPGDRGSKPAEQEALHFIATEASQKIELHRCFDSLHDDSEAKNMRQLDQASQHGFARFPPGVTQKASVDR
jgi:hypothetical protein